MGDFERSNSDQNLSPPTASRRPPILTRQRAAAISMPLVMIAHELVEQAHAKP